jgi:excisionase family DNA binding protein
MQDQATTADSELLSALEGGPRGTWRSVCREVTLKAALRKRAVGVPTYTVPEAAALLSVSQEHLYRLIKADAFPAVHMRRGRDQGRYIVPAKAVDAMLDSATASGALVSAADYCAVGGAA